MKTLIILIILVMFWIYPVFAMRDYDDPNRTRPLDELYEIGARRGERRNPAVQIIHGLDRMQNNIKTIRALREETERRKTRSDMELRKKELELKKLELENPEAVAALNREKQNS